MIRFYQCRRPTCDLRFPATPQDGPQSSCPRCGGPLTLAATRAPEARRSWKQARDRPLRLVALLDNLRSVFNVGSIFRTADGAGVDHLYLAGITPTPEQPRLAKTALGAERSVPWAYGPNGVALAHSLQDQGYRLWALESSPGAVSLFESPSTAEGPPSRLALVVGNEVTGVDPGILSLCDQICCIPMHGVKESLNVAIAFGIAAYYLLHR